jgi:hypothetical protein
MIRFGPGVNQDYIVMSGISNRILWHGAALTERRD